MKEMAFEYEDTGEGWEACYEVICSTLEKSTDSARPPIRNEINLFYPCIYELGVMSTPSQAKRALG